MKLHLLDEKNNPVALSNGGKILDKIGGYVLSDTGRGPQPYAVHRLGGDGDLYYGSYFETIGEAQDALVERWKGRQPVMEKFDRRQTSAEPSALFSFDTLREAQAFVRGVEYVNDNALEVREIEATSEGHFAVKIVDSEAG